MPKALEVHIVRTKNNINELYTLVMFKNLNQGNIIVIQIVMLKKCLKLALGNIFFNINPYLK